MGGKEVYVNKATPKSPDQFGYGRGERWGSWGNGPQRGGGRGRGRDWGGQESYDYNNYQGYGGYDGYGNYGNYGGYGGYGGYWQYITTIRDGEIITKVTELAMAVVAMEITVMEEVRNVTWVKVKAKAKGSRETGGRIKNSVLWYTRFPSNH